MSQQVQKIDLYMMIYCILFHYSISAVSNTKATVESRFVLQVEEDMEVAANTEKVQGRK